MFSHQQYDALHRGAGCLDRSDRGRLRLTGADRLTYLHGLLTNDIAALEPGSGCYAALLTPQGRMISDMRLSELGEAVLIDLPAATADTVRRRFADFIFTEDVEVHDVSPTLAQLGVYGAQAAAVVESILSPALPALPEPPGGTLAGLKPYGNVAAEFGGEPLVVVASDDYGVRGFDLFVPAGRAAELKASLGAAGATEVSRETATVTRVESGRPEFGVDMDEHTIPLEAGIEERAISMTKGCYVGQEVVIRILHRGHGRVAKRLVGLACVSAGEEMSSGGRLERDGRDVGVVTSAARSPAVQRSIGLGYVQRDHVQPGTVLELALAGAAPVRVTVAALPFTPGSG